ncbi:molybdopterin molybdotransferase [Arcanobacterium wilhelmae]|uniref:Molybdopterin molybdenumtransferase n=1 Tax=Arcanobacterium wilhelmae TaxID=1803177 RepID=A0ABT9NBS9_9ACTO|nr:gephyrin-like molybdotransferase Glp [Arcanobacterium wilhelmae]MDP9801176.1 molybdopterin molybdotransferase [Arcanobacterium wilhelmae]WFN90528.1 molybdopterin molybdotransferase MoeA [Arcanobacterium wilhelmae]
MKTIEQFKEECFDVSNPQPPFAVALSDAVGTIVADDVRSLVDVPQADLAAHDGYAVRYGDIAGASPDFPVKLPVTEEIRADQFNPAALAPGTAIRISSGARLPNGADTVVSLEDTDAGRAEVQIRHAEEHANIRRQAEDLEAGEVIVRQGLRVGSRQVALLASAGHARVLVHPRPRVVVMSIGDELQEPGNPAVAGKVFDANSHALASAVADAGGDVFRVGAVSDDKRTLREMLEDQLVRADIIITTGGLSYGGGDTLKEVLAPLGTVRFDNVAISPGRQFGVGRLEETTIFCLPGSPVAALTSFEVFIRPALRKMAGYQHVERRAITARVDSAWVSPQGVVEYVRGKVLGAPSAGYHVTPMGDPSRQLLTGLADANCLVEVPADVTQINVGDELACYVLDR